MVLFLLFILGIITYWYTAALLVNHRVNQDLADLSQQERLLRLPATKDQNEKEIGCTWSERQNWDSDGCYIGLMETYDENGPEKKAEQAITTSLLNNGWQKRQSDTIWGSKAIDLYGNNGSFIKQTSNGRFCAGISYRYFSDDMQSGPRSVALYILSPTDRGCTRW